METFEETLPATVYGIEKYLGSGLAEAIGADLFEIIPEKSYSQADVKWVNPMARCNREKLGKKDVPVSGVVEGFEAFATSGGSGMGKSAEKMLPLLKGVDRIAGESLFHSADPVELKAWAESL